MNILVRQQQHCILPLQLPQTGLQLKVYENAIPTTVSYLETEQTQSTLHAGRALH